MEFEIAIESTEITDEGIMIRWSDATKSRFHALWLRDNCPSGGDKRTAHRTFLTSDLDPDLTVEDAFQNDDGDLAVAFSSGHISTFAPTWLKENSPDVITRRSKPRRISNFTAGIRIPEMSLPEQGSGEHCDLLDAVAEWGAVIVNDVPTDEAGTEALAALVGHVRDSDFGRLFDIIVEPEAWESSQSTVGQDPHTDDPYRYTPSGTSILHCVEASAAGGESMLVDGFAIAAELGDDEPDMFDLLNEVKVPFIRHRTKSVDQGEDVHMLAYAPVIALDRDDEICGIRFHQRATGPFDIDPKIMGEYYRAFIEFGRRVNDPSKVLQFGAKPGQAILYDNQRVLHGRTAFTSDDGRRHMRLCTIDRDQFHSRLRRLREDHQRPGVNERLPSGNLS